MRCDDVQCLLAAVPSDQSDPMPASVRRHIDECPRCRAFRAALQQIDQALSGRPLPTVPAGFSRAVDERIHAHPRAAMATPFTRSFCAFSVFVTLVALVGAAWLLQIGSVAPEAILSAPLAQSWLHPVWASDASAWLSVQGGQLAQVVLALMAGIILAAAASAIGYRASSRESRGSPHDPTWPAVSRRP